MREENFDLADEIDSKVSSACDALLNSMEYLKDCFDRCKYTSVLSDHVIEGMHAERKELQQTLEHSLQLVKSALGGNIIRSGDSFNEKYAEMIYDLSNWISIAQNQVYAVTANRGKMYGKGSDIDFSTTRKLTLAFQEAYTKVNELILYMPNITGGYYSYKEIRSWIVDKGIEDEP